MDFELDFSSENSTMTSFLELEQEIREAPPLSEPPGQTLRHCQAQTQADCPAQP